MSKETGWVKVGTLLKNKDKSKDNYIKIEKGVNVTLTEGMFLLVQDPRKRLDEAVVAGRMDAEKAAELKAKIPDFVVREIILAPARK